MFKNLHELLKTWQLHNQLNKRFFNRKKLCALLCAEWTWMIMKKGNGMREKQIKLIGDQQRVNSYWESLDYNFFFDMHTRARWVESREFWVDWQTWWTSRRSMNNDFLRFYIYPTIDNLFNYKDLRETFRFDHEHDHEILYKVILFSKGFRPQCVREKIKI